MYGNVKKEYNLNDKVIFIRSKQSFDYGIITIINKYSPQTDEHCFVKNRIKPIGKLYIKGYTNEYNNILKHSHLPIDITKLILYFNTL